jgi:hypothetical protein
MSTSQKDLSQYYQHADDCQARRLRVNGLADVLRHLYDVTDDLIPLGSTERLLLNQLKRQLDGAIDTCCQIADVNQEYYLDDIAAVEKIEVEGATPTDDDIPF